MPACRDFVLAHYAELKKANPHFPILVREASGVEAKLIARYGECTVEHMAHIGIQACCSHHPSNHAFGCIKFPYALWLHASTMAAIVL